MDTDHKEEETQQVHHLLQHRHGNTNLTVERQQLLVAPTAASWVRLAEGPLGLSEVATAPQQGSPGCSTNICPAPTSWSPPQHWLTCYRRQIHQT